MSTNQQDVNIKEDSSEQQEQIQRLIYRLLPYWPLIVLAILAGFLGAKFYLQYQIPIYAVKARLLVNDETQQKSANLQQILSLDNKALGADVEKETQTITSKNLLAKLASKMQLNITYQVAGRIRTIDYFENTPIKLELEDPESVKSSFSGLAELAGDKISYAGVLYPIDSLIASPVGNIRWHINEKFRGNSSKITITIQPIAAVVGRLKGSISIAPISKGSSIVDITYNDEVPARGIAILTNLIELYGLGTLDYKGIIYGNTQKFLDERLRLVADELNGFEVNLQQFKSKEGIVNLGREGDLYFTKLKESDARIGEIDVQLDILKQIEAYVANRNNSNNPIPATLGLSDVILGALLTQLYQAEFDLQRIKQVSGSKNPEIEVYENKIAKLKPSILSSIDNIRIGLIATHRELQLRNKEMSANLAKIPLKEKLLLELSRQQGIKNAIYTFLLQKREESAIASASLVLNYKILEKPEQTGMIYPQSQKNYATSILFALIVIIIFIFLKEFSSNKILFRSQIEHILNLPVISELVLQPHAIDNPIVVGEGKRTLIAEQFRELRTNINYVTANTADHCKVILITSSIPAEGKSFVAMNSAVSLSLTGDRVVLLEFDLRRPKISKPLGISREPGLSNYLIGNASEVDIIKSHATIENFFIIPSGPIPPNPTELMSSPRLTVLINYLKQHYDYILIDSPPVAAVTDAKILAPFADATIYIIRHGFTHQGLLTLINDVAQKKNLPNINLVFNGIANKKIMGYYGYGKGYGYGYGYGYSYGYTQEDSKKGFSFKRYFKKN